MTSPFEHTPAWCHFQKGADSTQLLPPTELAKYAMSEGTEDARSRQALEPMALCYQEKNCGTHQTSFQFLAGNVTT